VNRAVTALASLGIVTALAAPSMAATTVYGSAQLKYTVNATAAVSIAVNYDATGAIQSGVASSILPSVAGNCTAGVAEGTLATLTFGGITPPASGYTGCYYKNAISVGVSSNDALGLKVYQYTDTLATGTQICAFQLNAAPAAAPTQSGASANPGPYVAACPTVNGVTGVALTALGPVTAGTGFGAAGVPVGPTTNVTATPTATTYVAGPPAIYSTGAAVGAAFKYIGEDIQMNVSAAATSGAATNVITYAVIPN
jgi:hypothetical protein